MNSRVNARSWVWWSRIKRQVGTTSSRRAPKIRSWRNLILSLLKVPWRKRLKSRCFNSVGKDFAHWSLPCEKWAKRRSTLLIGIILKPYQRLVRKILLCLHALVSKMISKKKSLSAFKTSGIQALSSGCLLVILGTLHVRLVTIAGWCQEMIMWILSFN